MTIAESQAVRPAQSMDHIMTRCHHVSFGRRFESGDTYRNIARSMPHFLDDCVARIKGLKSRQGEDGERTYGVKPRPCRKGHIWGRTYLRPMSVWASRHLAMYVLRMKTQPLDVQPDELMKAVNVKSALFLSAKTKKTIAQMKAFDTLKIEPQICRYG